jgi:hypothetical protein
MVSTRGQLAEKKSHKKVVSKKQSPKKTQTQSPKKTQSPNTCMSCVGDDGQPLAICLCDCGLPTSGNDPFMEDLIAQMDKDR